MFLYDYLKENPQERDKLIRYNWSKLCADNTLPFSLRNELRDVTAKTQDITDAVLFWHKQMLIDLITKDMSIDLPHLLWKTHWPEQLYTVVQLSDFDMDVIDKCYHILVHVRPEYFNVKLTIKDIFNISRRDIVDGGLSGAIVRMLTNNYLNPPVPINDWLLTYCTVDFIRQLDQGKLAKVRDMMHDIDVSIDNPKFNSMNDIERAHDKRTELMTQELIKAKGDKVYQYTKELYSLAKVHDLILPASPAALIKRGQQHNNCVGTYDSKHIGNVFAHKTVSRILFTRNATAEISFERFHGVIVATQLIQYKGAHNKNMEVPDNVNNFRLAITSKPANIIQVEVVSDQD